MYQTESKMLLRNYNERLLDYCKQHDYTLLENDRDYLIFVDENGEKIWANPATVHEIMLSEGIQ